MASKNNEELQDQSPDIKMQRKLEEMALDGLPDPDEFKNMADKRPMVIREKGGKSYPINVRSNKVVIIRAQDGELIERLYQKDVATAGYESEFNKNKASKKEEADFKDSIVSDLEFED